MAPPRASRLVRSVQQRRPAADDVCVIPGPLPKSAGLQPTRDGRRSPLDPKYWKLPGVPKVCQQICDMCHEHDTTHRGTCGDGIGPHLQRATSTLFRSHASSRRRRVTSLRALLWSESAKNRDWCDPRPVFARCWHVVCFSYLPRPRCSVSVRQGGLTNQQ